MNETPLLKRFALRFALVYFVLVNLPFPLADLSGIFTVWTYKVWDAIVPFVARSVFHVDASVKPNGSGDTTYNYVTVACALAIAVIGGALWAALDRNGARDRRIYEILRIYLRFALGLAMISYGMVKVFPSQFLPPTLERLVQPFGDASPMGLLWTFMGFSRGYEFFCGAAELLGGILLTMRRTTLLGAVISAGVLANIVAMNFFFDVPVKIYSSHLLAMAVIIALPDMRRIVDFFVLDVRIEPLFRRAWIERVSLIARTAIVIIYVAVSYQYAERSRRQWGDLAPRSPLHGVWNVVEFEVDGVVRPPLLTDSARWRRMLFDSPAWMSIQLVTDAPTRYRLNLDEKNHTMTLTKRVDPKWKAILAYSTPRSDTLSVVGDMDGHRIRATCARSTADFLLVTRGFHWINEYPFNR